MILFTLVYLKRFSIDNFLKQNFLSDRRCEASLKIKSDWFSCFEVFWKQKLIHKQTYKPNIHR